MRLKSSLPWSGRHSQRATKTLSTWPGLSVGSSLAAGCFLAVPSVDSLATEFEDSSICTLRLTGSVPTRQKPVVISFHVDECEYNRPVSDKKPSTTNTLNDTTALSEL